MFHLHLPHIIASNGMQMLFDLLRYLAACVSDGDYLNDWLTHLPAAMQPDLTEIGKAVASMFGG